MSYEQRDESGVLFKNDRKEKPSHPDYTGNARIGGREFWLSAWIKQGQNGKFMSLAFNPKDAKPAQKSQPGASKPIDVDGDEVPF